MSHVAVNILSAVGAPIGAFQTDSSYQIAESEPQDTTASKYTAVNYYYYFLKQLN